MLLSKVTSQVSKHIQYDHPSKKGDFPIVVSNLRSYFAAKKKISRSISKNKDFSIQTIRNMSAIFDDEKTYLEQKCLRKRD